MNNVLIYSKPGCHYCQLAKRLLEEKSVSYSEMQIGRDITREEFMELFPDVKSVPFMIVNGERVRSYDDLRERFDRDTNHQFLAE